MWPSARRLAPVENTTATACESVTVMAAPSWPRTSTGAAPARSPSWAPSHEAHRAGDGANGALALVNALRARLRAFLARFAGVSTRRLQHYLDWFCYAEQYAKTDAGREEVLAADQARGRYENSWRDLARTPQPFGEYWGMSTAL